MELCCNAKEVNFFIVVVYSRPIYLCGNIPILVICCISEIVRASGLAQGQSFVDHERMEHGSPLRSGGGVHSNGGLMELEGWSGLQTEVIFHILVMFHALDPFGHVKNISYLNTRKGKGLISEHDLVPYKMSASASHI